MTTRRDPSSPLVIAMAGSLPLAGPWNGADKVLARTIVHADQANRYLVSTGPDDRWPDHVTPYREPRPASMPGLRALVCGAAYLARAAPRASVLHVVASQRRHGPTPNLLRAATRLAGLRVVHTMPGGLGDGSQPMRPIGQATVVFSRHTADRLQAAGFQGVVELFPPLELDRLVVREDGPVLRDRLGLGERTIVYPGHLDEGGGVEIAIRALARLPADLDDVTLTLAVRWRPGQDAEAAIAALQADAAAVGVGQRLRWLRSVTDVPSLLSAGTLTTLVPASLSGKMDLPLVLLESLALGRPIVVTDRPPINEALLGGGIAVPFGDADALAGAWTDLLRDPARRDAIARSARARLLALSDPAHVARRYRDLYAQVLGRAPAEVQA